MKERQLIGLIDCNNFFVSCERLFRPDLESKPVLVLSSNDGCVVARSQEVKDMHIPMGVPYFQIKDIIKDNEIAVFSGNLTLYRDISRRVFSVVREQFSTMEQYSVDEAFFKILTDQDPEKTAFELRRKIGQAVGIPVSIGLAQSKTLAKYAATVAKKSGGVHLLDSEQWPAHAKEVPLSQIWGIGRQMTMRYKQASLYTVHDLIIADPARIKKLFGVNGERMQGELSGENILQFSSTKPLQKTLMSSRSFSKTTSDVAVLLDALAHHIRHVAADLRVMQAVAGTLRVSLGVSRHGDFFMQGGSMSVTFTEPTDDTFMLIKQADKLMNELYRQDVPYQKVGVVVGDIMRKEGLSGSLFTDTESSKAKATTAILEVVDGLNKRTDRELIVFGSRLKTNDWQAKATKRSGFYTTRWSDLVTVSAK